MNTMITMISSKQNSLVKYLRELRAKSARDREKIYLLEGAKSIGEAVASGVMPEKIIFNGRSEGLPVVKELLANLVEAVLVSDAVLDYISETETPSGSWVFSGCLI